MPSDASPGLRTFPLPADTSADTGVLYFFRPAALPVLLGSALYLVAACCCPCRRRSGWRWASCRRWACSAQSLGRGEIGAPVDSALAYAGGDLWGTDQRPRQPAGDPRVIGRPAGLAPDRRGADGAGPTPQRSRLSPWRKPSPNASALPNTYSSADGNCSRLRCSIINAGSCGSRLSSVR